MAPGPLRSQNPNGCRVQETLDPSMEPKDAFVAVSIGVFDRLTWTTYSVEASLLTGEERERHLTK
jgi:hypothetical protein